MKLQLKHVGYGLLIVIIFLNWYFMRYSIFNDLTYSNITQTPYYSDFDQENPQTWSDSVKLSIANTNLATIDGDLYSLLVPIRLFSVTMLDAIALALSIALIIHPANKK